MPLSASSRILLFRSQCLFSHRIPFSLAWSLQSSSSIGCLARRSFSHLPPAHARISSSRQKTSVVLAALTATVLGVGFYIYTDNHRSKFILAKMPWAAPATLNTESWTPIKLNKITKVSTNTSLFEFDLPAPCTVPITSAIYVKDDQIQAMRAYTPIHDSETNQSTITLLVKRYGEGQVSRFMHDARPGQKIEMRGPVTIWPGGPQDLNKWNHIGMIAGGTGITAFLPILYSALKDSTIKTRFSLLYASQSPEELYYKDELDRLASQHPNRFQVAYTIDRLPADNSNMPGVSEWKGQVGYINQEMVHDILPPLTSASDNDKSSSSITLVCGPESMVKHVAGPRGVSGHAPVRGVLGQLGYSSSQVFRFPN